MKKWDKTVLAVFMKWDYGIEERGVSGEFTWFYNNLKQLVENVEVLWYDEWLKDRKTLQAVLLDMAVEVKPDLIFFIPYTHQFTVETLDYLKDKYATYAWFGDDQWRFEDFSSLYAPHYSFISTTDPFSVAKYKKIGIQPILTQWAAQEFTGNMGPLSSSENFRYDVSFVGGKNESREWYIKFLAKNGIHVECFGAGWPNGKVSFEEMTQIFRTSKINLNLSNSVNNDIRFVFGGVGNFARWLLSPKRVEQIKARNFEIPLAGGFQISNYALGLERYLEIGKEIAVYNTPEDCIQQIHYYLDHDDLRESILLNSHNRTVKEHTYIQRLINILGEIWD